MKFQEASEEIWEICNEIYGKRVDLSTWKNKLSGHEEAIDTKIVHEAYDHTKEAGDALVDGMYLFILSFFRLSLFVRQTVQFNWCLSHNRGSRVAEWLGRSSTILGVDR